MTTTSDCTVTIPAGRNAALIACLSAADARPQLAIARKATGKVGSATYALDRATALALVKAAHDGAKMAKLKGQTRGAAAKAAAAIVQAHKITPQEFGLEAATTETKQPARKSAAKAAPRAVR